MVLDLCRVGIHCKKGIATVEFAGGGNVMYSFRQRRLLALGAKATFTGPRHPQSPILLVLEIYAFRSKPYFL